MKKKKLHFFTLTGLISLMFSPPVCGQVTSDNGLEWFPVGAKWTYSFVNHFEQDDAYINYMECRKDTIIDGITAKVLVGGGGYCAFSYGENIFYYNDSTDILYYYVNFFLQMYIFFKYKFTVY